MGFYTEQEEQARKDYVPVLRKRILEDLEILKNISKLMNHFLRKNRILIA